MTVVRLNTRHIEGARRVYLMLSFGKQPVACGPSRRSDVSADSWWLTAIQRERRRAARAWWIVEAKSAAEARETIANNGGRDCVPEEPRGPGRILAAGGVCAYAAKTSQYLAQLVRDIEEEGP